MENNQNQNEFSFEQLVEMSNFNLDEEIVKQDDIDLSLKQEEEKTQEQLDAEAKLKEEQDLAEKNKTEKTASTNTSFYGDLVKERLESGEWDDLVIDLGEEGEKKLSELSNLDKETFKEIEKSILEEKQKIFDTKYVEVDGLSETQVKLINIIKNGDLEKAKELFEKPETLQEPFQGYESDNDSHNEQVLTWFHTSRGHTPEEVKLLVEASKKDLSIDAKAQQIVDFQKKAFKEKLETTNKTLLEEKQKEENEIKEYRKNLMASLKEEGLGETAIRKFVDSATKKDRTGDLEIDTIYESIMKDPKQAKDLIYFMLDKDNYLKKQTSTARKDLNLDNLRKIKIVSDSTKTKQQKEEEVRATPKNAFSDLVFD